MKIFFVALLTAIIIAGEMPDTPPDTSSEYRYVDGPYGILISKEQNTYLEVKSGYLGDCLPNDCYSVRIYYTQVGGWFQSTERVLIFNQKRSNDSERVHFRRIGKNVSSPIEIYIAGNPRGKNFYKFVPPINFQQAYLLKPIINE